MTFFFLYLWCQGTHMHGNDSISLLASYLSSFSSTLCKYDFFQFHVACRVILERRSILSCQLSKSCSPTLGHRWFGQLCTEMDQKNLGKGKLYFFINGSCMLHPQCCCTLFAGRRLQVNQTICDKICCSI